MISHDMEVHSLEARRTALIQRLPRSMIIGTAIAFGMLWALWTHLPHQQLIIWCAVRMVISVIRVCHTVVFMRCDLSLIPRHLVIYRALAVTDAIAWSAMGWGLTPLDRVDIAAITISVMLGVAALGVFIMHMDLWSAILFIVPLILPNSVYALGRPDEFGIFCAVATFGLMILLLLEARGAYVRVHELFRLRFESEQVARAQAEALTQAHQLSEMKSRFVATMSHEMRTPLHGILGLTRMLSGNEHDAAKAHQLGLIHKSGDHLLSVINDVLDFSRMESTGLPIHKQAFDLQAVVREVAEILRIGAQDKHLTLTVKFDAETDKDVIGDAVRIRQVLNNLVGNAIKFTQEGSVCVHVTRVGFSDDIAIAVQDTGIGIPEGEIDKVFDPFHQAEGTYQRRFGGTGLGLTISRELCRAMGGDLQCRSSMGKGSEFRFVLPLQAVPREAPSPTELAPTFARTHERSSTEQGASPAKTEAPPHVLVVDDNPVNVLVAQAQLLQLGVTVTVMSEGQEAVDWLSQHRPDLVLMDCEMPGLDGFEATCRIREQERAAGREPVGIVAITANGGEVYGDRCLKVGMNGHLAKPFRPEDLALVLMQHLKGKFRRSALRRAEGGGQFVHTT